MVTPVSWDEWSAARDLQVRFARSVDERDWEAFEGCFAADVQAILPLTGAHSNRASLTAKIQNVVDRLDATQHFLTNHQVDRHEGGLRARCYVMATHARTIMNQEVLYTFGGQYDDHIVDRSGSLQIARRQLTVFWRSGDPSVLLAGPSLRIENIASKPLQ